MPHVDQPFAFRRVATEGCEIVGPEGVIGWTVDAAVAAKIVSVLNRDAAGDGDNGERPAAGHAEDDEETARRAVEYLADHAPIVVCTFPTDDPPSEEVRMLIEPCIRDAVKDVGDLLSRYVMRRLAEDFLGLSGSPPP